MRVRLLVAVLLSLPLMAAAQTNPSIALRPSPSSAAAAMPPGLSLPGGLNMPSGLLDEFWKDPAFAAEIHLTDAQRKQLDEAALLHRLALVDGGAESFKAVIKLSAILDAEPFDDAAYQKQLDELTASSGKLIQTFGAMVSTPRRVLNSEQWAKLEKRKRERARQATPKSAVMQPGAQPQIPSSLLQPLQQ